MKNTLSTLILVLISFGSYAQFSKPFSIGIGAGGNMLHGDLAKKPINLSGHVDLDILMNPFISIGVHGEAGKLEAHDDHGRDASNQYTAVNGNIKVRLGQFMSQIKDYNYYSLGSQNWTRYLANVYFGAGAGFIFNDVDAIRKYEDGKIVEAFDGPSKRGELIVPINIGIDIPFGRSIYGPTWAINVNYQHNISLDDGIDGYANALSSSNDHYSYFSIGVKAALFNRR